MGRMEVPRLEKERGSDHEGLNFTFQVLNSFTVASGKYSELV